MCMVCCLCLLVLHYRKDVEILPKEPSLRKLWFDGRQGLQLNQEIVRLQHSAGMSTNGRATFDWKYWKLHFFLQPWIHPLQINWRYCTSLICVLIQWHYFSFTKELFSRVYLCWSYKINMGYDFVFFEWNLLYLWTIFKLRWHFFMMNYCIAVILHTMLKLRAKGIEQRVY